MAAGFTTRTTYARETTVFSPVWPSSAVNTGAVLLPLLAEDVRRVAEYEAFNGVNASYPPMLLTERVEGSFAVEARYAGLEFVFAAALGFQKPPVPEELDTGVYRHQYEIDSTIHASPWRSGEGWKSGEGLVSGQRKTRRGTYNIQKGHALWQGLSCMLNDFTFSSESSQAAHITCGVLGYFMSTIGTPGPLDGLPVSSGQLLHQDSALLIREQSSDTFSELGELAGISFGFSNSLSKDYGVYDSARIQEPKKTDESVVSGDFTVPHYSVDNSALNVWYESGTLLTLCLVYVGEPINDDYSFVMKFWLPAVTLVSNDVSVDGSGQIAQTYSFHAAPQGEAEIDGLPENSKRGPLLIELVNENNDHPLL